MFTRRILRDGGYFTGPVGGTFSGSRPKTPPRRGFPGTQGLPEPPTRVDVYGPVPSHSVTSPRDLRRFFPADTSLRKETQPYFPFPVRLWWHHTVRGHRSPGSVTSLGVGPPWRRSTRTLRHRRITVNRTEDLPCDFPLHPRTGLTTGSGWVVQVEVRG